MSRLALVVVAWAALRSPAAAFEGQVLLPDGGPAVDATVTVLGATGSTRTGPDGVFSWKPDPHPPFQVLVILRGGVYATPLLVEAIPPAGQRVRLQIQLLVTESITVSAGSTPHTEAPPASGATMLAQEDLALRRPPDLVSAVEPIPGMSRGGEGRAAVPSIRGLARGRTLLLIDGARVTTERRAGPSATFLDPFFLEGVEVSRGLGSVAWGSDAFGGVIHGRTREPPTAPELGGRIETGLGAGLPERSVSGLLSRGLGEGGVIVQGRYREFEDFETPRGTIPNSGARDAGFRARIDHELGAGRLSTSWQTDLGRDVGRPADPGADSFTSYPEETSHRLTLGYQADPRGDTRWQVRGFLGWYELITRREALDASGGSAEVSEVRAGDYALRASGTTALGDWRLEGGLDFNGRGGLEAIGRTEVLDPAGGVIAAEQETSIEDAGRRDWAGYLSTDGRLLSRLTASAGLRFDWITTRSAGGALGAQSTGNGAVSAYGSLTAALARGWTLTGQVGSGFRDPTLSDRYFRGVTGRGFITGNPDLEPERSIQYDVVLRHAGWVRTALYAYRYEIRDLIERFRRDGDFFFRNRGRALIRGLELEAQADVGWDMTLELAAQAAEGRALDDDSALDDIPSEGLTLTLTKRLGERGYASLRGVMRARDATPGPNELVVAGYAVLDASVLWRVGRGFELRLALGNLLDAEYRRTADDTATIAPGRSAIVTLSAGF